MAFPSAWDVVQNPGNLKELFGLVPTMVGDVVVDVIREYTVPMTAELTARPVERGYVVSDARIIAPQEVYFDVVLTDPDTSAQTLVKSALTGSLAETYNTSWRDKRDRLIELFQTGELITVSTPETQYTDMVITEIVPERTAATANAWFCKISLKHVVIVSTETQIVDWKEIPAADQAKQTTQQKKSAKRAQKKADTGSVQTESASTQETTIAYDFVIGG